MPSLSGTVTLQGNPKSSKYGAILWLLSGQCDHEVLPPTYPLPGDRWSSRASYFVGLLRFGLALGSVAINSRNRPTGSAFRARVIVINSTRSMRRWLSSYLATN